jgi:hypothetical protein
MHYKSVVEPGMYIETSRRQIQQRQIWYYGRFGGAKSDTDASQHTYGAQPLSNTDI